MRYIYNKKPSPYREKVFWCIALFRHVTRMDTNYDLEIVVCCAFDFIFFIMLKIPAMYNATAIHVNINVTKAAVLAVLL